MLMPPYAVDMFVRIGAPQVRDVQLLYEGNCHYGVDILVAGPALVNFKIADLASSAGLTFSASDSGSAVIHLGEPITLVATTNRTNQILWLIDNPPGVLTSFRFTLDATNPTTPVLTVSEASMSIGGGRGIAVVLEPLS